MTLPAADISPAPAARRKPRKVQRILTRLRQELRLIGLKFWQPEFAETHGVKLWLGAPMLRKGHRRQILRDQYEEAEISVLDGTLTRDDIVLELGAGIGLVSIFCAKRVKDAAQVHVFEANPNLQDALRRNFALNGVSPDLHALAAAKQAGEVTFNVDPSYTSSGLHGRPGEATQRVQVPAAGFEELVERFRPTYLIMDIEGGEIELLPGAKMESIRKICLEVHPEIVGDKPISDLVAGLIDAGFTLHFSRTRKNVVYFERTAADAGQ